MLLIKSQVCQSLKKEILREHCFYTYFIDVRCHHMLEFANNLLVNEYNKKYLCTGNLLDWYNLFQDLTKYEFQDVQIYGKVFDDLYKMDKDLFKRIKNK